MDLQQSKSFQNLKEERSKWDLKKEPTRVLIKWLERARACGFGYDPSENNMRLISIDDLKEELATREHVPNKLEARKIRQARAK